MQFLRLRHLSRKIYSAIKDYEYKRNLSRSIFIEAPISPLSEIGEKVYVFKERTVEHFDFIKTYGFLEGGGYDVDYPEIDVWKINNAMVFHNSDFVVADNGKCAWPKYYYYNYAKNITTDSFFVREKKGILTYRKPRRIIEVQTAFSLIGVCAHIWAHAIVEYFPKLCTLERVIECCPSRITVLIPEYTDAQLRQVMFDQINKYDVDIRVVHKEEAIKVHSLYYMQRPTIFTDHEINVAPGDQVIPKAVIDVVKKNLVNLYIENVKTDPKYKKIFLSRRGGIGKSIINQEEIEKIFYDRGFCFIQPHVVSLEEKVRIFQSAEVIVGPAGSAFTNLIFCKPGTKALLFSNFERIFDYYVGAGQQYFGVEMMIVNGLDDKTASNMSHCSYYLPPDRVLSASMKMGII